MFSNGKFKNIVAEVDISKQIGPGESIHGVYSLLPVRGMCKALNIYFLIAFIKFQGGKQHNRKL